MKTTIEVKTIKRTFDRYKSYNAKTRAYIFLEGESILDNLQNRRNRPVKLFRGYLEHAMAVLKEKNIKAYWSQKAGCQCGCSPGFVIASTENLFRSDVFITVKVEAEEAEHEAKEAA